MKYYIIKPQNRPIDSKIIEGLKKVDREYNIVDSLDSCDIAVLQRGWTRSKVCVADWKKQVNERHKPCKEGYLFTNKFKVQLSKEE